MVWLLLIGATTVAVMTVCAFRYRPDDDGCPTCGHDTGLDGTHCSAQDDYNGWSSHLCQCQNDWHWNYESVAG
jgi:hypothetical protein